MSVPADERVPLAVYSPIGWWSVSCTAQEIVSLDYVGSIESQEGLSVLPAGYRIEPLTRLEQRTQCMLSRYFKGEAVAFERLPVAIPERPPTVGAVMRILRTIPAGQVHSYQWMAEQMGIPRGARAAGNALGRNPVPIIVPCHRIVAQHHELGGFMQNLPEGSRIKRFLLELEGHRFHGRRLIPGVSAGGGETVPKSD